MRAVGGVPNGGVRRTHQFTDVGEDVGDGTERHGGEEECLGCGSDVAAVLAGVVTYGCIGM